MALRSITVVILFFLLSACTKQVRPTPPHGVQKRDISLEELLDLYQKRLDGKKRLKALMEVRADLSDRGIHRFQSSWHSHGDQIEIRGFDLFGGTLFDLGLNGSVFSITIPSEQKHFEGNLELFDEMAGEKIPFGSLDLIDWVKRRGIPELTTAQVPAIEEREESFILYLFTSERGRGILQQKIWIERTAFRVKKVELFDRAGKRRGMVELNDYRRIDGSDFPFSIRGFSQKATIALRFREVSFPEVSFPVVPFPIDGDGR